jgi:hypothetical protein
LSLVNRPNRRKQFAAQHILVQICLRAEAQRSPDAIVVVECRDHDKPRFGKFFAQPGKNLLSADHRQIPIQQRNVGPEGPEAVHGFLPVTGFAHHGHVGLGIHDGADSLSHARVIVYDKNPNLICLYWHTPR